MFNLVTMSPYSLKTIYESLTKVSSSLVLYLPRTSDLRQLAALVSDEEKVAIVHYCMYGASKVSYISLIDSSDILSWY